MGFSQVKGIYYTKNFPFVANMNSIRLVISMVASFKWKAHEMDDKSTFSHGDLHEEINMEQPPRFLQKDSSIICQLKKSIYCLKKSLWDWYAKNDIFILYTSFSGCLSHNTIYTKKVGKYLIILVLYVDDIILTGSDPNLTHDVNSSLKKYF